MVCLSALLSLDLCPGGLEVIFEVFGKIIITLQLPAAIRIFQQPSPRILVVYDSSNVYARWVSHCVSV